jgi:hypothetical protein
MPIVFCPVTPESSTQFVVLLNLHSFRSCTGRANLKNSRPPTGLAPRLGVGCQSLTICPSSASQKEVNPTMRILSQNGSGDKRMLLIMVQTRSGSFDILTSFSQALHPLALRSRAFLQAVWHPSSLLTIHPTSCLCNSATTLYPTGHGSFR